jgi:hypothetical protein
VASSMRASVENDVDQPNISRIRDYWLDGAHHSEIDRDFGDRIAVCAPHLPYLVRIQRALTRRLVHYAIENGVRQFLDLGSGVPAGDNVHEVAQEIDPTCRVVYVDLDPGITQEGRSLLAGNVRSAYLQADIRKPAQILEAAELRALLDLAEPVAVLMIETLLHIPDSDDPVAMVTAYTESLCSGSLLAIAHFSPSDELTTGLGMFDRMFGAPPSVNLRDPDQLESFFTGLELVAPGIVPAPLWHPASDDDIARNPELAQVHVGLGRKP